MKNSKSSKGNLDSHINQVNQLPDKLKHYDLERSYEQLLPLIKEKAESLTPPSENSIKTIAEESFYSTTSDFLPEAESLKTKVEHALANTKDKLDRIKKRYALLPPNPHASITFFSIALLLGAFVLIDFTLLGAELINAVSYIEESGDSHFDKKPTILKVISVTGMISVSIALHALYFIASAKARKFIIGMSVIATVIVATICFSSYGMQYAPAPPSAESSETSKQAIVNAMLDGGSKEEVKEEPNILGVVFIVSLLLMPIVIAPLLAAAQKLCYSALQAKYPSIEAVSLQKKIQELERVNQKLEGAIASINTSIGLYQKLRVGFTERVILKIHSLHQIFTS